jgi:DNA-binding NarL/FixJ family response regulator
MDRELNIMLIEDDASTCKRFAEYVDITDGISIIAVTNNSYRGLEEVKDSVPDAVILDLELNQGKGNGLMFLQELKEVSIPYKPYILVTTNNSSSVTYDCARELGADFIMSKHQEDYSEKSAIDFLLMMKDIIQNNIQRKQPDYSENESTVQREKRLTRLVNKELDLVGISPKAVGYKYLTDAILMVINEQTSNLCTSIGRKYNKTDSSVERAMQNAINSAWRSNNIDDLITHYTARINPEKGVPTLTEFIYYYANKIKNVS